MDCGFKKIPFTLYTYVLVAKILQNGANSTYTKAGFKIYRNLDNFRQAVESPKSWHLMGFSPKKYIPSPKRSYTVDLSNINFNYLCVDSPNYLCHFRNHKSFFTTQLLCIKKIKSSNIIAILSTKVQILRLSTAPVKVHQNSSCHKNKKKKSVFLQSLDLFSVSWEIILLYFLGWNFMCYWQK